MNVFELLVLYVRRFCFYLAEQINTICNRTGIDIEVFSIDVALIIGLIAGYLFHWFFALNKNTAQQKTVHHLARQSVTIDGKTKEEVREKAKRQL